LSTSISIHLTAELDAELRKVKTRAEKPSAAAARLRELLKTYTLELRPLFPNQTDLTSPGIWHVACPEEEAAEVIRKLLSTPGVEGAYTKPAEGLPGGI
jgi:hypothetical protein